MSVASAPRLLHAARIAVAGSALLAPLAYAALRPSGPIRWLTLAGLVLGLAGGRLIGHAAVIAVLALGPVVQAAIGVATGAPGIDALMPWLAALAGVLWHAGAWRVTGPWAIPIATWSLVVATTWPVAAARELDFSPLAIGAVTLNSSWGGAPATTAAWIALAAVAQLLALLVFDWAWGASARHRHQLWRALSPGIAGVCVLAVWQLARDPAPLTQEPWITLGRAAGFFYDANATGALAALFGPLLALRARSRGTPAGTGLAFGWIALSLAAVLASGSRTSLLGWAVALGLSLAARAQGRRVWAQAISALAIAAVVALAVAFGASRQPGVGSTALDRVAASVRDVGAKGGPAVAELLWHRNGYGPAAMAIVAEHPWFGVGPGTFEVVIADYSSQAIGVRLPPDNAQNWWRHQWAELGLVGAFPAFACSLLALAAALRSWRRGTPAGAPPLFAPVLALGLMSFIGPPTSHPVLAVLAGVLLAYAASEDGKAMVAEAAPDRPAVSWIVWPVAAACVVGLAVDGLTAFRPPLRAARFHFQFFYGLARVTGTPLGDGWWSARRGVGVFDRPDGDLALRITLPHDDLATRPVQVSVSDAGGVVCHAEARDATALECRVATPAEDWPLVRIDVSRAWSVVDGHERAAFVAARVVP
jgi:hypothetical protein